MKLRLFVFAFFLQCSQIFSQEFFKAIVVDSLTKETLIGVTLMEKGKTGGGATGIDGKIILPISGIGEISILARYIGYQNKIITASIPQQDLLDTIMLIPETNELGEVTITSVRTNSRIEDTPTRIEVLGPDDLTEENGVMPGNIKGLLGDIAGVQLQQTSASSGNVFARIQGLNGRYTQILKDGMPLFGGLSGNFSIMQIPPLDLNQIEIIKGSASTLYGGDAIGGIINMVSKAPGEKPELDLTINRSTFSETNFNGYYSVKKKKAGLTLFAAHNFQTQQDVDGDGLSDVPEMKNTVLHPKLFFYFNPKSTLTLNYTAAIDRRRGGDMNYFNSDRSDTLYHIDNSINRQNADFKYVNDFSKNSQLIFKGGACLFDQKLATKYYLFDASQFIFFSEVSYLHTSAKSDWVAGINFNGDKFNNKNDSLIEVKDYNYHTAGAFIQNTWRSSNKITFEYGMRADRQSEYNYFILPRLSFMYKFDKEFTGRINGGLGYKIPILTTYVDQETDLNKIGKGNSLSPEKSTGINADINYHKLISGETGITVNQSFFYTGINNPVDDSSSMKNIIYIVNENKLLITKGVQTYVRVNFKKAELYLSYVFTDVERQYKNINPQPTVTPRHNLSSIFIFTPGKNWSTGIESSLIAGQTDEDYNPVKDYFIFALMFQYRAGIFTFVLNGENMLDFRQNKSSKIYDGTIYNPVFHELWAPIDGRVINFSVKASVF